MEKKQENKKPMAGRISLHIRNRMISGILLCLPLGITFVILRVIYNITAGILMPFMEDRLDHIPEAVLILTSLFVLIVFIYLIGAIGAHVIGKRLISFFEMIIINVPILKTIYSASKNIVNTLSSSGSASFKSAVFIEFPKKDSYSIGFVTGEVKDSKGIPYYKIFVPTAPNPTSGFLQIIPVRKVIASDMPVEDAVKMVISGGIMGPSTLKL